MYWKSALSIPYSPLMDCYFYTSANGEWQVAVYTLLFFFIVSINGLLLLHIYKRRMGCEPYMPYGFPSLWLSFIVSINGLLLIHICK